MRVQFHGLRFDLPPDWTDITDDLIEGAPPTLARPFGRGVIQFSTATYRGGANPEVTVDSLRMLLGDFFARKSLNCRHFEETNTRVMSVGCVGSAAGEVLAAWYLSNGQDVALVTYTSMEPTEPDVATELEQTRGLIASIEF
ncbi:hypothetical protein [Porphyrobacter sp. ULC335]|jgi:hypothetical protein|uniref:hypothetical protein n=1 Tax=Porphyrobacter sp. ULC335 TaxID=2854260 RepID=UPI00222123FC|nr:hypothetical protein [Porphyrobacter sp. ULC335]UYV16147.1 hypothetical protein KVF90_02045 [Porphyrobacter sp. ULC335]